MAKQFGAIPLDGRDPDLMNKLAEATEGRGADAVLEAVGSSSSVQLAFDLVRPGGIVSSVGVCNDPTFPFTPVQAYNKNLTYKSGRCPARHMMDELVPVVQSKKFRVGEIFTHRMKLSEGVLAYEMFAARRQGCLKVVLQP
jgi:threonine dehydrogenase-like Zn-dependent dehydrogenase